MQEPQFELGFHFVITKIIHTIKSKITTTILI